MTDLEALERTAKAARDVGEAWLTHDDLTGVYPEVMAFIVEASPTAVLSLLSADRAALLAIVQKVAALRLADANGGKDNIICGSDKFDVAGIVKAARAALTEGT